MQSAVNRLKEITLSSQKFEKKIEGKEFLLGKFFKNSKKKCKHHKFEESKVRKMLTRQQKISQISNKTYECYRPLHQLWLSYAQALISQNPDEESRNLRMLRSDFHGSCLRVVYSKVDSYIGLEGIVLRETLRAFVIITQKDKQLLILKADSIFHFSVKQRNFIINGSSLMYRPSDRVKHKFKFKKLSKLNLSFLQESQESQEELNPPVTK